jgi:hypothetical protein
MSFHEIKHDGFRVIARKAGEGVKLYSRPAQAQARQPTEILLNRVSAAGVPSQQDRRSKRCIRCFLTEWSMRAGSGLGRIGHHGIVFAVAGFITMAAGVYEIDRREKSSSGTVTANLTETNATVNLV